MAAGRAQQRPSCLRLLGWCADAAQNECPHDIRVAVQQALSNAAVQRAALLLLGCEQLLLQAGQLRVDSGTWKQWPGRLAIANAGSGRLFRCCRTCDSRPCPQPLLATACSLHPLHSPPQVETSVTPAGLAAAAERRLEGRAARQRPVGRQPEPLNQPAAYGVASWAAALGACGGVQRAMPFKP